MTPPFEQEASREERENQILDAATAVFARQGITTARMDDIGQEAGLSKGTLYWYFKSKESLTLALLKRFLARQLKKLQQLPVTDEAISEQCFRFMRQFMGDLARIASRTPLALDFYALAAHRKDARQLFRDYFQRYSELLAPFIQLGIERGELRPVDVTTAVNAIIALFEGVMVLNAFGSLTAPLPQEFEAAMQLLFDGLSIPS